MHSNRGIDSYTQKLLIVSAPSGAGKTTIVEEIVNIFDIFEFSVSATTRSPRYYEQEGVHYYFLSRDEFFKLRDSNQFIEWEEVYPGRFYGTLKSEVERILNKGRCPIFDVDVEGGLHIKEYYGEKALSIFIKPPDIQTLEKRLQHRATDSESEIYMRVEKARKELMYAPQFDYVIVNDLLDEAVSQMAEVIRNELALS